MSRYINFPERVEIFKIPNHSLFILFKKKISTIVLMDHAKMEEIVQMLWIIITVAV